MKITLELFKGKKLSNDNYPILVRITNSGKNKYKGTKICIKEKNWNALKKRITCREKDYKIKNTIIENEYQRICNRTKWFEDNNIEYDFDFIVSDREINSYNNNIPITEFDSTNFLNIIIARIRSYTKIKTKENYQAFYNVFKKIYGDYINNNSINQYFANDFRNKITEANYSANHKNSLIKCFTSSYKFGVANRWIERPYIFELKKFPYTSNKDKDITYEEFTMIINCYKKKIRCYEVDEYKALAIFILDIALQGLAPVDLANIKISDIKVHTITKINLDMELYNNDKEYQQYIYNNQKDRSVISINTYRAKTNTYVPICSDLSSIKDILLFFCHGKDKDDYLIDCFSKNKEYTEKQKNNRCGSYFMKNRIELNHILENYCSEFNYPKIKEITYYYARHAFINAVDKMDNVPTDLIRKMVGHRNKTLEKSYINKPTNWEQSSIIYRLFNQIETIEKLEIEKKGIEKSIEDWKELHKILS